MSEGKAAVWEAVTCVVAIVTEGGMDDDGLGSVVVRGVAVEAPVDFFLGVLTHRQARRLPMMVRASPTSWLEPLAETTRTPETECG